MSLTAEQRYRQAMTKARIISRRSVRKMMAGENDDTPCTMDLEKKFVIAEIATVQQLLSEAEEEIASLRAILSTLPPPPNTGSYR